MFFFCSNFSPRITYHSACFPLGLNVNMIPQLQAMDIVRLIAKCPRAGRGQGICMYSTL